jgi:hypothetical protein
VRFDHLLTGLKQQAFLPDAKISFDIEGHFPYSCRHPESSLHKYLTKSQMSALDHSLWKAGASQISVLLNNDYRKIPVAEKQAGTFYDNKF